VPYILIDTAHMDRAVKRDAAAWELPGMVLAQAGIDNDPYFALTRLVAPELANLTRAPDAPVAPENVEQKQLDEGMRNIAELRLKNKLDGLWAKAAAMAQQNSTSTAAAPVAHGMR
jgi:hypothetical protein